MICLLCHHEIFEDSRFTNYCSLTCYNIGTIKCIQWKSKLNTQVDDKSLLKSPQPQKNIPEPPKVKQVRPNKMKYRKQLLLK